MAELVRLESLDDLEAWLERSHREPVWVFKHSLTCGTSSAALDEFESFADAPGPAAGGCAIIEVQTARRVSNELARRTGVRHESPQVLLLNRGAAVWHASHWRIRADGLRRAAGEAAAAGPR